MAITTTAAYKTAINADSRHIIPKVDVYFDGDTQTPTTFTGDDVTMIDLLEEANAEGDNPLGFVSSNEFALGLNNSSRDFTQTNTAGAYYGKLRPNILVKPYLGVQLADLSYEDIPLGVYRTGDWDAPSSSVEATVTCYDKLYAIGNMDMPMLPVSENATIYSMFETLFLACGLVAGEYVIDTSLAQNVFLGWLPDGKVRDSLQIIAVAGCCNVVADRYEIIQVKSNFQTGTADFAMTDSDQIITAENPQKYLQTYNSIKVAYKIPYLKESETVLSIESLTIPQGGLTLTEMTFNTSPVANVDQVNLLGAVNSSITSVEYGCNRITIVIANTSSAESVALEAIGQAIDLVSLNYVLEDAALVTAWGRRQLSVDNILIQSLGVAQSYAGALLQLVKDPNSSFTLEIRGDPSLEVNDIISVTDATDKIGTVSIVPQRIQFSYNGALDNVKIDAIKPIVPYDWTMVGIGLYVYAPRLIA